jgi:hypothetical protein
MHEGDIGALEHGLSPLLREITPAATFPLAYWRSANFAEVVSLGYVTDHDDIDRPRSWTTSYERVDGEWCALGGSGSGGWGGLLGPPGSTYEPSDKFIWLGMHATNSEATDGRPAVVVMGWHTPEVAYICLVQESNSERRAADGHYGAWIIGSEREEPWTVEAYDGSGHLLGSIEGPRPPEVPLEVIDATSIACSHSSGGRMELLTIERYEKRVEVTWQFTFHGDSVLLLSADDETEMQEHARSKALEGFVRDKRVEEWRRLRFVTRMSIADDLSTEYQQAGGGGSASGSVAKWTSGFRPPIPQAASFLTVRFGEMVLNVPLA